MIFPRAGRTSTAASSRRPDPGRGRRTPCQRGMAERNAVERPAAAEKRKSCARNKPRFRGSSSVMMIMVKLRPENPKAAFNGSVKMFK